MPQGLSPGWNGAALRWSVAVGVAMGVFLSAKLLRIDMFSLVGGGGNHWQATIFLFAVTVGSVLGVMLAEYATRILNLI